jgi:hypothetical protein
LFPYITDGVKRRYLLGSNPLDQRTAYRSPRHARSPILEVTSTIPIGELLARCATNIGFSRSVGVVHKGMSKKDDNLLVCNIEKFSSLLNAYHFHDPFRDVREPLYRYSQHVDPPRWVNVPKFLRSRLGARK